MEYYSVKQICSIMGFPEQTMRQWMLRRDDNGLYLAVRKIGSRVFIRKDLFIEWIEKHTEEQRKLKEERLARAAEKKRRADERERLRLEKEEKEKKEKESIEVATAVKDSVT